MRLNYIGKGLKKNFKSKKRDRSDELVKKVIMPIKEEKEITDEQIAEKILELMERFTPEERNKFLEELVNRDEFSQNVIAKSAVKISDSEEIPDAYAVELASQVSDKATVNILENADLTYDRDRLKIIDTIEDDEIKEDQVYKELKNFYDEYNKIMPSSIFSDKIKDIIGIYKRTDKINEILYKTIAKNFAMSYHDYNKAIKTYDIEKIVPADELVRIDMSEKIEDEYEKLLEPNEDSDYDREEINKVFLDDVAKSVTKKALEEDKPVSLYMPNLGVLKESELQYEIERIKKYDKSVNKLEEKSITNRLTGKKNEGYNIDGFITNLRKLPKTQGEQYLNTLSTLSPKEMDTIAQCINSGLIESLSKQNVDNREKCVNVFKETMEKREKKNQLKEQKTEKEIDEEVR